MFSLILNLSLGFYLYANPLFISQTSATLTTGPNVPLHSHLQEIRRDLLLKLVRHERGEDGRVSAVRGLFLVTHKLDLIGGIRRGSESNHTINGYWLSASADGLSLTYGLLTLKDKNGLAFGEVLLRPQDFIPVADAADGRAYGIHSRVKREVERLESHSDVPKDEVTATLRLNGTKPARKDDAPDQPDQILVDLDRFDLRRFLDPHAGQSWTEFRRGCAELFGFGKGAQR